MDNFRDLESVLVPLSIGRRERYAFSSWLWRGLSFATWLIPGEKM